MKDFAWDTMRLIAVLMLAGVGLIVFYLVPFAIIVEGSKSVFGEEAGGTIISVALVAAVLGLIYLSWRRSQAKPPS